ncbi:MAG: V-type ATPase subunit [Clostridiales bacterium]|jgi:V/A-type H+-transporting ATPase subunit C|nr:V-type ATPase subunit [Clostridiales bacterium]
MVLEVTQYGGIFAKIKALNKNLLTYGDYYELASQKDIKSFSDVLFSNDRMIEYTRDMQKVVEVGRVTLEKSITSTIYDNFNGIYSFVTDVKIKKYLKAVNLKYRVGLVKGMLRSLYDERIDEIHIPKNIHFLNTNDSDSYGKLMSVKNFAEFLDALRNTEFHGVLSSIKNMSPSLYELESQLDNFFYSEILKCQNKYLNKKDRQAQEALNGSDIDIHNILYIYRIKKHYNNIEAVYPCLIPIHYKLNRETVSELIKSSSEGDFRDIILKSVYRDVFNRFSFSESAYFKYMYKLNTELEKESPYSLQLITSYMFKKGQEVRNLITLIECVRYGLRAEESIKKLNILGYG